MANYADLKTAVQQVIKTNGNNEITGAILQQALLSMINSLGVGYQFAGIAGSSTNPGTPDQRVFYVAFTAGTYSNFGNIVLNDGDVAFLVYDGSWSKLATNIATKAYLDKSVQLVCSGNVEQTGPMKVRLTNVIVFYKDNSTLTVYANSEHTPVEYTFATGARYLVITADGTIIQRATASQVLNTDILLLQTSSSNIITGGWLLPFLNKYNIEQLDVNLNTSLNLLRTEVKAVVYVASSRLVKLSETEIGLTSVYLFKRNGTVETIYGNSEHTQQSFVFNNTARLLVVSQGELIMRDVASHVQDGELVLLQWTSTGGFIGGLLLPQLLDTAEIFTEQINVVSPKVEIGRLTNNGRMTELSKAYGSTNVVYIDKTYWRTSNFIQINNFRKILTITATINVYFLICYYDENFNWLASGDPPVTTGFSYRRLYANTDYEITTVPENAKYIKFCFRSSSGTSGLQPVSKFNFTVKGVISTEFVKNVKTPDVEGYGAYQTVAALVNVTNPNSTDTMTDVVQDVENLKFDYGVLALPLQYSNIGKPTRLIIYCHGAGANYTLESTRFHSSIDARLWLSEGYAVLDMDSDPYTDSNVHGYMPGARQCLESAYKWIVEHYNICQDGILLAGKSMGGGMTFDVLSSPIIPVIASCAIVPVCNYIWWWTYMNATRRAFVAQKLGFVGVAPMWTSQSPMTTDEWEYLQANYDKFIMYDPFGRLIANPPSKEEMFANMNLAASNPTPTQDETALWATRIAKVRCPVKIFIGQDDTTVPPLRNGKFMFEMLRRGSEIVEYREFTTGGHGIENPSTTGFGQDITNSYGQVITNAPVVFAEILNFWRRYENG